MAEFILKNTSSTLSITFSAGAADAAVTVTTTRADGTAGPTGTATHGAGGVYTFVLVPQTELDVLTVTWAGSWGGVAQSIQTVAEIVGGNLFSLADLRAFGDRALANITTYPDETLRAARTEVTELFERVTCTSFIPRYGRETVDGTGNGRIWLEKKRVRRLISISVTGVALSAPDLALVTSYTTGRIDRDASWPRARHNIVVAYEYGWPSVPARIAHAAMVLARYELVSNDISDRMVSFDNDLGQVRLSVPGRNFPTGIPFVDSVLVRYDESDIAGMVVC